MAKECKRKDEKPEAPTFKIVLDAVLGRIVEFEFASIHGEVAIQTRCDLDSTRDFARKLLTAIDREG